MEELVPWDFSHGVRPYWGCQGLAVAQWKKASLPSDLFIDSGVWGPLMDEQPHYLSISFPGCQMQRVTAFTISHVGQRIVPQKNLNHIPRRQKSTMSLQKLALYVCIAQHPCTDILHLFGSPIYLSSLPSLFLLFHELLVQLLISSWTILSHISLTHHLPVNPGFLDNPSIFHFSENVWSPCLNLTMFSCLWYLNSIQG